MKKKQPRQTRLLRCPIPHCIWSREETQICCATHWEKLPKNVRLDVMRARKDPVRLASLEREVMGIWERLRDQTSTL